MGAIGRLGLAIVGRSIGGPWGGLIGAVVGSLLFPDKVPGQHSEGPRLQDLSVTTSTYGAGIPWVWGQYLVPGNIIWVGDTNEHAKTTSETQGGKGGGGPEYSYTEYSYTTSFAVGLCKGPMHKVVKIFLDNQLVYDALGGVLQKEVPGLRWRFYSGSEEQLPDSIIQAKEDVENVPAFRGLCYVVFDELNITEFGNRIPSLQFVVQDSGNDSYVDLPLTQTVPNSREFFVDLPRGLKHQTDSSVLETVDLYTQKTLLSTPLPRTRDGWEYSTIVGILPSGDLVMIAEGPRRYIYSNRIIGVVSAFTHTVIQESGRTAEFVYDRVPQSAAVGQYTSLDGVTRRTVVAMGLQSENYALTAIYAAVYEVSASVRLMPFASEPWQPQPARYMCSFFTLRRQSDQGVEFFWLHMTEQNGSYVPDRITLSKVTVADTASAVPILGQAAYAPNAEVIDIAEYSVLDFDPTGTLDRFYIQAEKFAESAGPSGSFVDGMLYDAYSDTLVITAMTKKYIIKVSSDGEILWRFTSKGSTTPLGLFVWRDGTITNDSTLAVERANATQIIDLGTGTEIVDIQGPGTAGLGSFTTNAYSASGVLAVYPNIIRLLDQAGPGRIPVSRIISDVSAAVGQTANDYSDIDDLHVLGYASTKPTDGRSIIDPLATAFNFDAVDTGGYVRWVKRGAASVAAIDRDSLIAVDESGSVLDETRAQEVELPQSVGITYADSDRNYEPNTFYRQRFAGNEGYETTRSKNQINVEIPAAIEPDVAKRAADIILMSLWNGRTTQKFSLPPWAALFDPGDVITLDVPDAFPKDVRIGKQTMGADLVIEIESSSEDSSQYISLVTADPGLGYEQPALPREQFTDLYLLPVPYLRDVDDTNRQSLTTYYAMGALRDGWTSGSLQRKPGDAPWVNVGGLLRDATHGVLIDALLPSTSEMVFSFQPRGSMRVRLVRGDLQSVTYEQMMEGSNAAAIIRNGTEAEVVQFRDAILEEDGSYTLSGLLRGRRGTDYWACTGRATTGTAFVMLGTGITGAVSESLSKLGNVQQYRAYGANQLPEQGDEESIVLIGNELKPYAPVHPVITIDGYTQDLTLSWERRSRVRGELRNLTGDVPLEEDIEAYEIDVLGDDGAVLRTISTNTPTLTYVATDQSDDGFSLGMRLIVYQMSVQIGRGFPLVVWTPLDAIDVAAQSNVILSEVAAADVDVAAETITVLQALVPVLQVAQQSEIVLYSTVGSVTAQDVAQQADIVVSSGRGSVSSNVAQQADIILVGGT